jgi:surface protein
MLDGAKSFEQNLCAWGMQPAVQLALSIGNAKDIFRDSDSGCKHEVTPHDEDGPFCAPCKDFTTLPADGEALKAAVRDYVTQECATRNGTCFVAQQWGYPMRKWDVSQVTDMSGLFYDSRGLFEDFNEDITGWDTGSVTDMSLMFKDAQSFDQDISNWKLDGIVRMTSMLDGAKSFEQNLCAWGEQPAVQLALSIGNAKDIFRDSGCNLQITPQNDRGPFCASCDDDDDGVRVKDYVMTGLCPPSFILLIAVLTDTNCFLAFHRPTRTPPKSYSAGKSPVAWALDCRSLMPAIPLQQSQSSLN